MKLTRQERYKAIESNPKNRQYKVTMLRKARNRAKKRGIYFNLTLDDIQIGERCPILDTPFKVAKFGISSVVSIVDDELCEEMRHHYSDLYN